MTSSEKRVVTIPVFRSKEAMREFSLQAKKEGKTIALIGTLGYLHEGHLALVAAARQKADVVVTSIYVNPSQFTNDEDFDLYPRDPVGDHLKLQKAGCHAIFEPASIYHEVPGVAGNDSYVWGRGHNHPEAHETWIHVERLQLPLCGKSRPHYFKGVATAVCKVLNIMLGDVMVLGQKDYQQNKVIERLLRDLDMYVKVVVLPIVREPDGLAMSSRNVRLSPEARVKAVCIYQALMWAEEGRATGQLGSPTALAAEVSRRIVEAGGRVDYVEVLHADNLQPIQDVAAQPTLLAVAAFFPGKDGTTVQLIDNTVL